MIAHMKWETFLIERLNQVPDFIEQPPRFWEGGWLSRPTTRTGSWCADPVLGLGDCFATKIVSTNFREDPLNSPEFTARYESRPRFFEGRWWNRSTENTGCWCGMNIFSKSLSNRVDGYRTRRSLQIRVSHHGTAHVSDSGHVTE